MLTIKIYILYIKSWNTYSYFVYLKSNEELNYDKNEMNRALGHLCAHIG